MNKYLCFFLLMLGIASDFSTVLAHESGYTKQTAQVSQIQRKNVADKNATKSKINQQDPSKEYKQTPEPVSAIGVFVVKLLFVGYLVFLVGLLVWLQLEGKGPDIIITHGDTDLGSNILDDVAYHKEKKIVSLPDLQEADFIVEQQESWLYYVKKRGSRVAFPFEVFSDQYIAKRKDDKISYKIISKNALWVDKKFKKVHWSLNIDIDEVEKRFGEGYDLLVITYDGQKTKDAFFIHPQLKEKMALYLRCLYRDAKKIERDRKGEWWIFDDISSWELGTLLSYPQEEAFAFTFGSKLAKKAYPHIEWDLKEWGSIAEDDTETASLQGLTRLRVVLGDQLQYIEVGQKPDGKLPEGYETSRYTIENGWESSPK